MSMQIGAAPIGGWLVESEPDHAAPRSARSGRTDAGTQPRHAGRTRGVQPSDVRVDRIGALHRTVDGVAFSDDASRTSATGHVA